MKLQLQCTQSELQFSFAPIKNVTQKTVHIDIFLCCKSPYLKMFSIFSGSQSRIEDKILSQVVTLRHLIRDLNY